MIARRCSLRPRGCAIATRRGGRPEQMAESLEFGSDHPTGHRHLISSPLGTAWRLAGGPAAQPRCVRAVFSVLCARCTSRSVRHELGRKLEEGEQHAPVLSWSWTAGSTVLDPELDLHLPLFLVHGSLERRCMCASPSLDLVVWKGIDRPALGFVFSFPPAHPASVQSNSAVSTTRWRCMSRMVPGNGAIQRVASLLPSSLPVAGVPGVPDDLNDLVQSYPSSPAEPVLQCPKIDRLLLEIFVYLPVSSPVWRQPPLLPHARLWSHFSDVNHPRQEIMPVSLLTTLLARRST
jgi:hypothetical protein